MHVIVAAVAAAVSVPVATAVATVPTAVAAVTASIGSGRSGGMGTSSSGSSTGDTTAAPAATTHCHHNVPTTYVLHRIHYTSIAVVLERRVLVPWQVTIIWKARKLPPDAHRQSAKLVVSLLHLNGSEDTVYNVQLRSLPLLPMPPPLLPPVLPPLAVPVVLTVSVLPVQPLLQVLQVLAVLAVLQALSVPQWLAVPAVLTVPTVPNSAASANSTVRADSGGRVWCNRLVCSSISSDLCRPMHSRAVAVRW
jgi:hypothetical protein